MQPIFETFAQLLFLADIIGSDQYTKLLEEIQKPGSNTDTGQALKSIADAAREKLNVNNSS